MNIETYDKLLEFVYDSEICPLCLNPLFITENDTYNVWHCYNSEYDNNYGAHFEISCYDACGYYNDFYAIFKPNNTRIFKFGRGEEIISFGHYMDPISVGTFLKSFVNFL